MVNGIIIISISLIISFSESAHFRGGTITWRPLNSTPSGTSVQIQIRQRYSWNRASVPCNDATIAALGSIGDNTAVPCISGACFNWNSSLIYTKTYCTDFSVNGSLSSGEKYDIRTVPVNASFSIVFTGGNWFTTLVIGSNGLWSIVCRINTIVRPDGYINNSPIATTLPVIYKAINVQHVHVVEMSDLDSSDTLRCRWPVGSTANVNSYDECKNVCNGVSGAVLFSDNCTLVFTLTQAAKYVAVALQIEDYYTSTSPTPMSSVPLQFLFYGYSIPSGCSTPPAIIGNRPNRACIGTPILSNVTEYVIAQVYCAGKIIIDFTTSSPIGLTKSVIQNPSPAASQFGPQGFCAGAVDSTSVQSNQWCITFLVGYDSPDLTRTSSIQGTASPIGTIFANHTTFSIQANRQVNRPSRNYTYVYFNDASTNTSVYTIDCGWSPNVIYSGNTIVFYIASPPWLAGHSYYVTFDSGVASGTDFCKPESSPITDRTFWTFDVWDPGVSSTTSSTTTPPTTATITTRPLSTSSVNTLLTTTGVIITSSIPATTTTTTATTSTSKSMSSAATVSVAATTTAIDIISAKDFEKACESPVAVMTAVTSLVIFAVHGVGMFVSFVKLAASFDPNMNQAKQRHKLRMKGRDSV